MKCEVSSIKVFEKLRIFKRLKDLENENKEMFNTIIAQSKSITTLQKLNHTQNKTIDTLYQYINNQMYHLQDKEKELINANKAVLEHFDISVDHGLHQKNWAVICIKGKPEYVKFIDLGGKDIKELIYFIKQFEGCNRIIDSPYIINSL